MDQVTIFWFRRDLRLHDNAGLYEALKNEENVLPLFIFDRNILDDLNNKADARVTFIHDIIQEMQSQLIHQGSSMLVRYGFPQEVWSGLINEFQIKAVYTNRDYEPYAKERDEAVKSLLTQKDIPLYTFKDHVIFERLEVQKKTGGPYTVFTPYSRTWKQKLEEKLSTAAIGGEEVELSYFFKPYPTEDYFSNFISTAPYAIPELDDMGFEKSTHNFPSRGVKRGVIRTYDETRNFPALSQGTSHLGIHFRFGTISIRQKAYRAQQLNDTFLNELIWRDFYAQIMENFPKVAYESFRPEYDYIEWRNNESEFQAWCEGRTGYPIVDAGMRELDSTGYMHNRVRMITASFLTKHLLIDWRWGEAYFAEKLLDFDLASNNGGWQWAAGSGTDAAPYFRIFNPESQQKKFDKDLKYIKQWVPEYGTDDYPEPIVDHKMARERCLATYKAGLEKGKAQV